MTKAMPGYRARHQYRRTPLLCKLIGHNKVQARTDLLSRHLYWVCWRPGCTWKVRA